MNQDGWIKYHRRSLESPMFKDVTAWHIWDLCLLLADRNGQFTIGRNQLAEWSGVKGTTAYQALQRLKNAKMVTIKVTGGINNRFSVISICNWKKYQQPVTTSDDNLTDNLTDNQLTHYKNKELNNIHTKEKNADYKKREIVSANLPNFERRFPDLDVPAEWQRCQDYFDGYGKAGKVKDWSATFRNWLASPYEKKRREGSPSLGIRKVKND